MREVKTFFKEDNRLNKGYAEDSVNQRDGGNDFYHKKISESLPPPDVLAVYEEMHPGTFEKLLGLLDVEQKHRHAMDKVYAEMQARVGKMGRLFGFFIICAIGYVTLELAKHDMLIGGLIFAGMAFVGIFGVSLIMGRRNSPRPHHEKRYSKDKRENTHHVAKPQVDVSDQKPKQNERRNTGRPRRRG